MSLSETLLLSKQSRVTGGYDWLPDNLLVSSPDADGLGGLLYLPRTRWFRAGSMTLVDRYATGALWSEPGCLFRAIQDTQCLWITVHEDNGRVWRIFNSDLGSIHDILMLDGSLYVVSTATNEVARVSTAGIIEQKWMFPGGPNSWHLNGLSVWDGRLVVSARGRFNEPRAHLKNSNGTGIVFDLMSGETLMSGLSGPHTPRAEPQGRRFLCDSLTSRLLVVAPNGEERAVVFPGAFPRGIAWSEYQLYVGLSSLQVPDGTPGRRTTGGIAILDRLSLEVLAEVELPFPEVYDIVILDDPT